MKKRNTFGNLLLLLTAVIWGSAFVAQRTGMESIEPFTFNAARMLLAAVFVGIPAMVAGSRGAPDKNGSVNILRSDTFKGGVTCGVFLALASLLQQAGIVYTSAGKASFITSMYMLYVPVLGSLFFRKKNRPVTWPAIALGVFGMYLLCINGSLQLSKGDALIAGCSLFFGFHILFCDRYAVRGNPIGIAAIQFATVSVISFAAALLLEHPTTDKILLAAGPILYCGIISGGLGYTFQIIGQRHTEPAAASLILSLESVFAVLTEALFLNERLTGRECIGCVVMFLAVILVQLPPRR